MEKQLLINKASEKLLEIKDEVLSEDRHAAMEHFKIAYSTTHRYTNGEVKKPGFATDLYSFYKKRIEDRKAVLA